MRKGANHIGTGICPECEDRVAINSLYQIGHHGWIYKNGHKVGNACLGWYGPPILGSLFPIELNTEAQDER